MESSDTSSMFDAASDSSYTSNISDEAELFNELNKEETAVERLNDWTERFKRVSTDCSIIHIANIAGIHFKTRGHRLI